MKKDKTIWITGASSGIGKALTIEFVNNNLNVAASSRRIELIKQLNEDLLPKNKISIYKLDITNFKNVQLTSNLIRKNFEIDCLINNAGITSFKPFVKNTLSEIQDIINTNLLGSIYTIKSVLPEMIKNNSGTIINILSVAAKTVFANSSIYSASKAGLEAFTKVVREETRGHNIKIINIFPGATASAIWPSDVLKKYKSRMMSPQNLADFIFNIYNSSANVVPEEIVLRPITGDL